jgi:hypothetical protein
MYGLTLNSIPNTLGPGVANGRRYPRYQDWQGTDIPGEVFSPQDLPNPYGLPRIDPMDRPWLRPFVAPGPAWNM